MRMALRIVGSFFAALVLLVIGGIIRHPYECFDCFEPYGFPFTYRQDGGYAGGSSFYLRWLTADLLVLVALTGFFTWAWGRRAKAKRSQRASGLAK